MQREFSHEANASRYVLRIDGQLVAVADYLLKPGLVSFTHTYTAPRERGNGYAAEVVDFAMADVEEHSDRRVLPMCWYVAAWFDSHPERAGLLTRGGTGAA